MSGTPEIDLQALAADWQGPAPPAAPANQIRDYIRRRTRLFAVWAAFDTIVGTAFLVFLIHRTVTHPDPLEKLAMGLLAAITAATMAYGWWNWHGPMRASSRDTRAFVAFSAERSRRFARNIRVAWVVLAAEVAVFTPWVYHRLYADGRVPSRGEEIFGWGFLGLMTALAIGFILALRSWSRRDAAAFEQIRRELDD